MALTKGNNVAELEKLRSLIAYNESLKNITRQLHIAENIDDILINLKDNCLALFDAERITIYAVDHAKKEIYSKIKEGNEKLAKLLGWFQEETTAWYVIDDCAKYIAYSEHSNYPHKDLPFLRDWNYLMKVVDKIGTIEFHREDDDPKWNWKEHYSYMEILRIIFSKWLRYRFEEHKEEFNLMNDLESIWCGCVAYVNSINEDKE